MITNLIKVYEISCPKCGKIERLYRLKSTSQKALRRMGWHENSDHVWFCVKCKGLQGETETSNRIREHA